MVSLKQIAESTGVSVSTASRALNGSPSISEKTRKLIEAAALELGYSRKRQAAGRAIGVIVPEISSIYYAKLLHSMESAISENGYTMIIGVSAFTESKIVQNIDVMSRQNIEGLICSDITIDSDGNERIIRALRSLRTPVVLLSENSGSPENYDCIRINHDSGIGQAVALLAEKGHKQAGIIGDKPPAARMETFLRRLREASISVPDRFIKIGDARFEQGGYEQMRLLLHERNRPAAVVALYDQMAIGALKAIRDAGLRVPGDVSLISYDNIDIGGFLPEKLTTITNPVAEMGRIAARILFHRINHPGESATQHVLLQSKLVIRETT